MNNHRFASRSILAFIASLSFTALHADAPTPAIEPATLIFSDDFDRDETTPNKEEIGNGWTTNSAWRAPGKKQADLKDGALAVGTDPTAGHPLVLFHPASLGDGTVEFRFKIGAKDSIGIEFADPGCKTVHAGHLCGVRIGNAQLSLTDMKTGVMDLNLRERRLTGEKDPELDALLRTKTKAFPIDLKADEWHTLRLTANGDTLIAKVDGNEVGTLTSKGIAHPTKVEIRINVGKAAIIDDVKIWKLKSR